MIFTCVECGDLSPLLPLSEFDLICIRIYRNYLDELRNAEILIQQDIRFFLARLSGVFTDSDGMNFLPSKVAEMGRIYAEQHPEP